MRALIWKEYREKRLWILILTASVVYYMARGFGYTFVSTGGYDCFMQTGIMSDKSTPAMLLALFFGAGAFSSEIDKSGRFLFSHPVTWKKLFAAKLIVGFGVLAVSALLTAVIFRIICPAQYAPFETFQRLSVGVVWAVFLTGVFYLVGIVCSVVFPGAAGGIVVLFVMYALLALEFSYFTSHSEWQNHSPTVILWLLTPVAAMFVTLRAGLIRPVKERLFRYAATVIVLIALGIGMGVMHLNPDRLVVKALQRLGNQQSYDKISIGPDGQYALAGLSNGNSSIFVGPKHQRVRLSLNKWVWPMAFFWPSPNTAIYAPNIDDIAQASSLPHRKITGQVIVARMNERGKVSVDGVGDVPELKGSCLLVPSPSGKRFIMVSASIRSSHRGWQQDTASERRIPGTSDCSAAVNTTAIGIADCTKSCTLIAFPAKPVAVWWQSEDEIGYRVASGAIQYVPVTK